MQKLSNRNCIFLNWMPSQCFGNAMCKCMCVCVWMLRALALSQMWLAVGFHIHCTDESVSTHYSLDTAQQSSLRSRPVTVTHKHTHTHTPPLQSVPLFLSLSDVSIATAGRPRSGRREAVVPRTHSELNTQSKYAHNTSQTFENAIIYHCITADTLRSRSNSSALKQTQLKYVASITVLTSRCSQ